MSVSIEFGTKGEADAARDEHADYVADSDDRRLKTVEFDDDLPDLARDQLEAGAATGRAERQEGTGQAELTQAEKKRLEPFTPPNNYLKAASVKALLRGNGVDDWTAWYDQTLTVDEHRSSVLPEAIQAGGGSRFEDEGPDRDRAAAAEKAANSQCNHAQDHCEHGEPEACEFLTDECGYSDEEIEAMLDVDEPVDEERDITGPASGALGRAWQGYKAAVSQFDRALGDVQEQQAQAERAAAAINSIRASHGQPPMEFERLEELSDDLSKMGETAHDGEGHVEEAEA